MKTLKQFILVCGGILLLLFLSNPSHIKHKEKIREAFAEKNGLLDLVVGRIGQEAVVYHDYTLFSLGEFNGEITSFGMLGILLYMSLFGRTQIVW